MQLEDHDPDSVRAPRALCSPPHSSPSSVAEPQASADHFHSPLLWAIAAPHRGLAAGAAGKEIKEPNDTWRLHLGGQRTMSSYCDYARAIVNMCFCWVYINLHMFQNSPGDGKPLGTMLAFPITIRHVLCCCLIERRRPCVRVRVQECGCVRAREEGTLGEEGSWNWEVVLSIICGTWRERVRLSLCHSVRER